MPTRAEETRKKMMKAKVSLVKETSEKERRKNEATHELRTVGVSEWVKFEVQKIVAKADKVAQEEGAGEIEILLPRDEFGYYDILRSKYYDTLGQFDIGSIIPDVHKLIILSLRASGYKVTDPEDKEFPHEYDGMPGVDRRKIIVVSW